MTTVAGHDFGSYKYSNAFVRESQVTWTLDEAVEAMKLVNWLIGGMAFTDEMRQVPWVAAILEIGPEASVNAVCDFGIKRAFEAFEKEIMEQRGFIRPLPPLPRRIQNEKMLPGARILTNRFLSNRTEALEGRGVQMCHRAERGPERFGTLESLVDGSTDLCWVRHDDAGTPAVYLRGEFQVL